MSVESYDFILIKFIGISVVCIFVFLFLIAIRIVSFENADKIFEFDFHSILLGLLIGMPLMLCLLIVKYHIDESIKYYNTIYELEKRIERIENADAN